MFITKGSTNVSINIRIIDSTDGTPETAVEHNTAGIDMWYRREAAVSTDITEVALAALTTAHTDGGIEHINDGWYRLDVPDAAFASGVDGVQIGGTVTGMVVLAPYVQLTDIDVFNATTAGITNIGTILTDSEAIISDTEFVLTDTEAATGVLADTEAIILDTESINTDTETNIAAILTDTEAAITARSTLLTDTEAVLGDTETLTTDWNDAGRLDAILDAVLVDTETVATVITDTEAILADSEAIIVDTEATGTTAVIVDAVWDEVITNSIHNTANSAGKRLRQTSELGTYSNSSIYIDTVNGAAGTTDFENGTDANPVNTIADANTLAASLGISTFHVASGSSITFAASQTGQHFEGSNWTLALGGQDINNSVIDGATVTGTGTNTTGTQFFNECQMGAVTIPGDTHVVNCGLTGTQTMGEAGDYFYEHCHSGIAGSGSVTIDFNTPGTETNLNCRHHSGGWTVENMGAGAGTCNASFEGNGQITWAATCSATSNASIRGNWKITDSAGGAVTETLDDNQTVVDAILVDTEAGSGAAILADTEAILGDSETLTTDWNDGGRLDLIQDAILVDTEAGSGAAILADTEAVRTLSEGLTGFAAIDTVVDAVLVDTEAAAGVITDTEAIIGDTEATRTLAEGLTGFAAIDTVVDAILVDTEAAAGVITDTEAILTDTEAVIVDTEAATGVLADTEAVRTLSEGLTGFAAIDTVVDAVLVDTEAAAGVITDTEAIISDTEAILTDSEAVLVDTEALPSVSDILTTQMTESYAADGAAPTLAQALMLIQQQIGEFAISGTTLTVKKVDGSTTAGTFTLDDATNPTSITRAT